MSIRMNPNEDHNVIRGGYCPGYTDPSGKHSPSFYCPGEDTSEAVYCCGHSCCTKKEEFQTNIPDLTLILGIICGALFALAVLIILSCFFCSFCLLYKRRHTSVNGPLYQMHHSSTGSGVANMYSFSNQNSSATTPIDTNGPHPLVELEYHHSPIGPMDNSPPKRSQAPHSFAAVDLIPTNVSIVDEMDAPPPYEASAPDVTSVLATGDIHDSPVPMETLHTSEGMHDLVLECNGHQQANESPEAINGSSNSSPNATTREIGNIGRSPEEALYWSTKF